MQMTVGELSRRPGLTRLSQVLGRAISDRLRVVNAAYIAAHLDCGARMRQTLRASPSFRHRPWYHAVLFDGDRDDEMLVGEVCAIIRERDQDVAIICTWEPVAAAPACPLAARPCTRLKLALPLRAEQKDWCLRAVPLVLIRRLVHVVPDLDNLAKTHGWGAMPPVDTVDVAKVRGLRYFVNDFYPWG